MLKISVVIPTKNRFDDLLITLEGICQNTELPHEVIIVDQSSDSKKDDIYRFLLAKKCGVLLRYFHRPDFTGLVEAREFGVAQSTGDIIQFLDDDITLSPNFFAILNQIYSSQPDIDVLGAVDISEENLSYWRVLARSFFWRGPFHDNRSYVNKFHARLKGLVKTRTLSAGLMSCRRKVFEDVGFANDLPGHVFADDIDFSYRASFKYNIYLAPQLKAVHRGGLVRLYDVEEGERKRVHSRFYFFRKNIKKTPQNIIAFLWLMVGTFIGAISRCISYGSLKPAKGFLKGLYEWLGHKR